MKTTKYKKILPLRIIMYVFGTIAILSTLCIFMPALSNYSMLTGNTEYFSCYILVFGGQLVLAGYLNFDATFNFLLMLIWFIPLICGAVAMIIDYSVIAQVIIIFLLILCGITMFFTKDIFIGMCKTDASNLAQYLDKSFGPIVGGVLSLVSAAGIGAKLVYQVAKN